MKRVQCKVLIWEKGKVVCRLVVVSEKSLIVTLDQKPAGYQGRVVLNHLYCSTVMNQMVRTNVVKSLYSLQQLMLEMYLFYLQKRKQIHEDIYIYI